MLSNTRAYSLFFSFLWLSAFWKLVLSYRTCRTKVTKFLVVTKIFSDEQFSPTKNKSDIFLSDKVYIVYVEPIEKFVIIACHSAFTIRFNCKSVCCSDYFVVLDGFPDALYKSGNFCVFSLILNCLQSFALSCFHESLFNADCNIKKLGV